MAITLRPYQLELVDKIRAELIGGANNVLVVSPTGSGKTRIFCYISDSIQNRGKSVTIVAHRAKIVDQIGKGLSDLGVQFGFIRPGYSRTQNKIQVAMVKTLLNCIESVNKPDILIVDEAHHTESDTYKQIISKFTGTRVLGFTATPERLDGRGLGDTYQAMVFGPDVRWLIDNGHLADYDYHCPPPKADLSKIDSNDNDALREELNKNVIFGDIVDHYRELLHNKPAIAYCRDINHSISLAKKFTESGYSAEHISGKMTVNKQNELIDGLSSGNLHVLTSCDVISEGTDIPSCQGIILARPTKSIAVYLQQVGRGLRVKPDGSRAIILDHVGNVYEFGLPDSQRIWTLSGHQKNTVNVTQCPKCYRFFDKSAPIACDDDEENCPLKAKKMGEIAESSGIGSVDGKLIKFDKSMDWKNGISIATATGYEYRALLDLAGDNADRLREIAKIRKYKRGWIQHRIDEYSKNKIKED